MDFFLRASPILIPFFIGLFRYSQIKRIRFLFFFICYGILHETAFIVFIKLGGGNSMPLSHLYAHVSFYLLCLFYQEILKELVRKKYFYFLMASFFVLWLIDLVFFGSFFEYPSFPKSISTIVTILFSIGYFYKIMVEAKVQKLAKEPLIWINTSILIYFTGNLFYYILFNLIFDYSNDFLKLTSFYFNILNGLFYLLISIGFYLSNASDGIKKVGK